jgi:hypothetical protein
MLRREAGTEEAVRDEDIIVGPAGDTVVLHRIVKLHRGNYKI